MHPEQEIHKREALKELRRLLWYILIDLVYVIVVIILFVFIRYYWPYS